MTMNQAMNQVRVTTMNINDAIHYFKADGPFSFTYPSKADYPDQIARYTVTLDSDDKFYNGRNIHRAEDFLARVS